MVISTVGSTGSSSSSSSSSDSAGETGAVEEEASRLGMSILQPVESVMERSVVPESGSGLSVSRRLRGKKSLRT